MKTEKEKFAFLQNVLVYFERRGAIPDTQTSRGTKIYIMSTSDGYVSFNFNYSENKFEWYFWETVETHHECMESIKIKITVSNKNRVQNLEHAIKRIGSFKNMIDVFKILARTN